MRNPYYDGPTSGHFDGTRFFNPGEAGTDRSLRQLLRWRLTGKRTAWPNHVPVEPAVPSPRVEGLRVTLVGHASVLIQTAGLNVLTDPVWSARASPFRRAGPKRAAPPGIAFSDLPPIDAVLLSHNHYDHLDVATLRRLVERDSPLVVTPLGNDTILRRNAAAARIAVGDWGDRIALGDGVEVSIVPANHWSARGLGDRRMALWGGFMLRARERLVYFAGDTGYGSGAIFRAMRRTHGAPDLALIPIGAFEPRWFMSAQHCDPEEAVRIFGDLEARRAIAIHWGTFQLTDEGREAPLVQLAAALSARGIEADRFEALPPGAVRDV